MPQDFKIKKKNLDFVLLLVALEILSYYPDTDFFSIGLEKTFNGSWLKFSEKSLWFKWLRHFLLAFFEFLLVFVVVSIVIRHCNVILINYARQISLDPRQGTTERIY